MSSRRPLSFRPRRAGRGWTLPALVVLLAALGGVAMALSGRGRLPDSTASTGARASVASTLAGAASALARPASSPGVTGRGQASYARQARAVEHVRSYTPFIAAGTRRERVIALTFDDGPSPYTPAIVRTLVRLHVPATFFVVGQQLTYFAEGLRDEVRHGFVIGDHTQNHAWLISLGAAGQYSQIHSAASALLRYGAPGPLLFRPPYGAYNRQTVAVLRRLHMLMVLWTVDPGDWREPGTKAIVKAVLAAARPGAIVLMHDGGGDRTQTLAAIPAIVDKLRQRHYRLVTVPQLLRLDPPSPHQRLPSLTGG